MNDRDLLHLVEKIYAASLNPDRWQQCLEQIGRSFGDAAVGLYTIDSNTKCMDFLISAGLTDSFAKSLTEHYAALNPYPAAADHIAVGVPISDADLVARAEVRKTEFYSDWIRPQGRDVFQVGCKLSVRGAKTTMLAVHPDTAAFESMEPRYLELIMLIAPHIARAVRINRFLNEHAHIPNGTNSSVSWLNIAAFDLNQNGTLKRANKTAENLLAKGDVVTTAPHGKLVAADPSSATHLEAALESFRQKHSVGVARPVQLTSKADGSVCAAWLRSVRREQYPMDGTISGLFSDNDNGPELLLLISTRRLGTAIPVDDLQALFHLTPAEARLASALAEGEDLTDYASRIGVSRNTVRAQLSRVFEKTGTNRQAELVATIWRTIGVFNQISGP